MTTSEFQFFAPIANAKGQFRSLSTPEPFKIERWSRDRIVRLWRQLASLPKFEIEVQIEHLHCVPRSASVGHVVTGTVSLPTPKSANEWIATHNQLQRIQSRIENQLRLISLYGGGQCVLASSYWYEYDGGKTPIMVSGTGRFPSISEHSVSISPRLIGKYDTFSLANEIPLSPDYLQLAFEHWEESMRQENENLEFLSLMVAIEALFNVGPQDIRYRVSRSIAVLLGRDIDHAEEIFNDVRLAYDVRSKLVHTGKAKGLEPLMVWRLRFLVQQAILRMYDLNQPKDEIMRLLTRLGFGQGKSLTGNRLP